MVTEGIDAPGNQPEVADATHRFHAQERTLYVVATPLGNLRDLTLRALDLLQSVDVIAAEDTRVTAVLLRRYGILTRVTSLHEHNEARSVAALLAALSKGQSIALVSDAGTPAISDPGARLVRAVADAGIVVVPVPGPCALSTAISAAGLNAATFVFLGFLPRQAKARRETLLRFAGASAAIVMYEAPHRVADTVAELAACFDPQRDLIVARELTKTFETITRVPLAEATSWFAADSNRERGEFVLIVDVLADVEKVVPTTLDADGEAWLVALLAELPPARAARVIAARLGIARDIVYARALALKPGQPDAGAAQDQ